MAAPVYSERLGHIATEQFQAALDHFQLGQFVSVEAIPFGLFGQNVFLTSMAGEFVLRGAAHYEWQFPKEQFIARLLHERTSVPVPWPYLLDTNEDIFGWKYGYVIMPRMPGLQLADEAARKSLTHQERAAIAYVIGHNLRDIQQVQWPVAGRYDHHLQTVRAFKNGFAEWLVSKIRVALRQSLSHKTGTTRADVAWAESIIRESADALKMSAPAVLVLHDYKEGNLTVERRKSQWVVSGVFDLMEALFGDGELDLVRQLAEYIEEPNLALATSYLSGYQADVALRAGAYTRLRVYMLYDRLVLWDYFHRPELVAQWWYGTESLQNWVESYLVKLQQLVR